MAKRKHAHNYKGERRHVTLRLPMDLIKRLKLISRETNTKLNALITDILDERTDGSRQR